MRDIKFRAWDKQDKRMIVDKQDFIPLIVTNKSVFKLDPTSEKDRWIEIDTNRFELMQYTGLKDKNGVEIYFDDLTRINNTIYRVIEFNGAVAFVCPLTGAFWNYACNLATNKFGELAGNIYENTELLN